MNVPYSTAISICPANGTNKINIPNTYTLPQYESTAVSDGACTVFYPVKLGNRNQVEICVKN